MSTAAASALDRPYWNMEIEPHLGTPRVREIQLDNLRKMVAFAHERSAVWREIMDKNGVVPAKVRTLADFQAAFAPVEKDDMRNVMMEWLMKVGPRKALEALIAAPFDKVVLTASTSGTTGDPTPYFFTRVDLDATYESMSRVLWRTGLRPGHVLVHAMALSMFAAGVPMIQAIEHFGVCVVPLGAEAGTERVLNFTRMISAMLGGLDALAITPSFAEHLIESAPKFIGKAKTLKVKRLICGGEPGAGIPEVRQKIEEGFGAKLYDAMGLGPLLWASCGHPEYTGMHWLTEDVSLIELVDPETRAPIPLEDGATGALVGTPLRGEGLVVFRHLIGDVAQVFTSPCPCGQSGIRLKIVGRIDDMLKVKGVLVYPSGIDSVVTGFVPRVTGEFRIILDEPPPRVVPPLKMKIERGEATKPEDLEVLTKEIQERMHAKLRITPQITWLEPGTLPRSTHKAKYIEKSYEAK